LFCVCVCLRSITSHKPWNFSKYFKDSFFFLHPIPYLNKQFLWSSTAECWSGTCQQLYTSGLQKTHVGVVHALVCTDNWVLKSLGGFQQQPQVRCLGLPVHIWNSSNKKDLALIHLPSLFWFDTLSPIGKVSVNSFKGWHKLTAYCRCKGLVFLFSLSDFVLVKLFLKLSVRIKI
jgi:hypothetical protein